jgi:hypothetical protein
MKNVSQTAIGNVSSSLIVRLFERAFATNVYLNGELLLLRRDKYSYHRNFCLSTIYMQFKTKQAMRFRSALKIASLEPRAASTSESTATEPIDQTPTAPAFAYATPPAPLIRPVKPVATGGTDGSGLTGPAESGISLGVFFVLLVGGLLLCRFNKRRKNKRSKANQGFTLTPSDPNPSISEPPAQYMSGRQREKMPATNSESQATTDDDEIRLLAPQKAVLAKKGGWTDNDSKSMVISPC